MTGPWTGGPLGIGFVYVVYKVIGLDDLNIHFLQERHGSIPVVRFKKQTVTLLLWSKCGIGKNPVCICIITVYHRAAIGIMTRHILYKELRCRKFFRVGVIKHIMSQSVLQLLPVITGRIQCK